VCNWLCVRGNVLSVYGFACAVCLLVCVVCTWLSVVSENCVPLCPVMFVVYVVSSDVLFAC